MQTAKLALIAIDRSDCEVVREKYSVQAKYNVELSILYDWQIRLGGTMKAAQSNAQLGRTKIKISKSTFDTAIKRYTDIYGKKISSTKTRTRVDTKVCKKFRKFLAKGNKAAIANGAQSLIPRSPAKRPASILIRTSVTATRPNNTGNRTSRPLPAQQPAQLQLPMVLESNSLKVPGTDIVISPIALNMVNHIVRAFKSEGVDKMGVKRLLKLLNSSPDSGTMKPWAIYNKGKPMGARQLNTILMTELGIHSFDLRTGVSNKVVKGLHGRIFELLHVAVMTLNATMSTNQFLSKFPRSSISVFDT